MKLFDDIIEKKAIKKLFIRNTIFVYIPVVILFIILFLVIYSIQISNIKEREKNIFENETMQKLNISDKVFGDIDKQIYEFQNVSEITTNLLSNDLFFDMSEFRKLTQKFNDIANTFMSSNSYVNSIGIYFSNSDYILKSRNFPQRDELKNIINNQFKDKHTQRISYITGNTGQRVLTIIHRVNIDYIQYATIIYNINYEELLKLFIDLSSGNYILIKDSFGNVVVENGENKKKASSILVNFKLPKGYEILTIKNSSTNIKIENIFTFRIIILLIVSLVLIAIITFFISVKMYVPLKNIVRMLEKQEINQGNIKKSKEYEFIFNNIISTFKSKYMLEQQLFDRLNKLKKMQSIALQSQVNPHFLSNTLQIIGLYAEEMSDENNKVTFMIKELSKMLKYTFQTYENLTTVSKEMEYLKIYTSLQKERYTDKFDVVFDIQDEILNAKIAKITFQPIIENAIHHGIRPSNKKCVIMIIGRLNKDDILFKISNDGIKLGNDKIKEINMILNSETISEDEHIGLNNVNQRLKIIFGNKYGVTIGSDETDEMVVYIKIPFS